ncbi:unnamed protein product [Blepharisma stoltei]|uniref:alpha-1,2-Mannosidase n=1 Tax=Blepharisma stoltei TaxID=1481888 RepID=A0AAU9IB61_9CILI|nr:unnamed protein product [Blepharisma stoltei]
MALFLLVLLPFAFGAVRKLEGDLEQLIYKSFEDDKYHEHSCKRPVIREYVNSWDKYQSQCMKRDLNDFAYSTYVTFLEGRTFEFVRDFNYIWKKYITLALGNDTMNPVTGAGENPKGGISHMFFANLDTLYLMGTEELFEEALKIVEKEGVLPKGQFKTADYVKDVIGGLLGGFYVSEKEGLLEKAKEAGELLPEIFSYKEYLPFESYDRVKKEGTLSHGSMKVSDISNQAEALLLYKYTGDERFLNITGKFDQLLNEKKILHEYLPVYLQSQDFKFDILKFAGPFTMDQDSVHIQRNLFNAWILSNKTAFNIKEMYDKNKNFIIRNLTLQTERGELFIASRGMDRPEHNYRMHQATCAFAGQLAIENKLLGYNASEVILAKRLMETCIHMYLDAPNNLAPNYVQFTRQGMEFEEKGFTILPDIFDGLLHLFRLTGDEMYRKAAYFVYTQIVEKCRSPYGYSNLKTNMELSGVMPDSLLSKTLKYLFLLFNRETFIPVEKYVYTPAGHVYRYVEKDIDQ